MEGMAANWLEMEVTESEPQDPHVLSRTTVSTKPSPPKKRGGASG
jgi:hypothetical protein